MVYQKTQVIWGDKWLPGFIFKQPPSLINVNEPQILLRVKYCYYSISPRQTPLVIPFTQVDQVRTQLSFAVMTYNLDTQIWSSRPRVLLSFIPPLYSGTDLNLTYQVILISAQSVTLLDRKPAALLTLTTRFEYPRPKELKRVDIVKPIRCRGWFDFQVYSLFV